MTLVRRTAASKGKCKLSFNRIYSADKDPLNFCWWVGNKSYPFEYFQPVSEQTAKPKPRLVHDSATGKLKVEDKPKPTREDVVSYIKANGGVNMPAHQLLGYLILEGVL